ncbi:MFS transporter [Ligilactobacillus murinus]|uniref:MFS transporter n=1 Tax=Ligilactobacillus murinus TaxID=1622 RepID=UPI001072E918|nr:MFS transporter [Ligilactobacillus murinus]MBF0759323.1 MFS transporter [Ligilactobacillus murinus]MBF0831643.1 MFS transporter [Ligilactobacillus murinus]TFU61662.1 MFS transporter [Ligilactobacillus murinus]
MKKNFRLFITSDIISQFGAGLILVALNWYIIDIYHSNSLIAIVANINVIAGILISIVAVGILKCINARWLVISSICFRIFFIVLALVLFKMNLDKKLAIYLLALSGGIGWNLYFPASKDILNSFMTEDNALQINSFAEISMQVGLLTATLFSGILYRYVGFKNILVIGIVLFVSSLLIFSSVKYSEQNKIKADKNVKLFSYFLKEKWLLLLGIVLYIPFIGTNIITTALPGYIKDHLSGNSIVYGITDTMYGVGACLASFVLTFIVKYFNKEKLILFLFIFSIILGAVLSLNQKLSLAIGYIFLLGMVEPVIRTIMYTRTMEIVPSTLLGAVVAFWNFINLILQFFANYGVGKVMDDVGPQWGFIIYAGVMILGSLIFIGIKKPYKTT